MAKKDLYNFIKDGDINDKSIEDFMSTSNSCKTKPQLLSRAFKLLNYYLNGMIPDEENITMLNKIIDFIAYVCDNEEFNREQIDTNRIRIKKSRDTILILANKYLNDDLVESANKLDEIVLDKNLSVSDIIILIKNLIDRIEDINIIKKIINVNKQSILERNNTLFEYAFDKAIEAIKEDSSLSYYYISLLKVLYASNIDKKKYIEKLKEIPSDNAFANELYMIVHGIKRGLTPEEILDKYLIDRKLTNQKIIIPQEGSNDNIVITIDNNGTYLKEDGISLLKDGSKYIVGIHIADPGRIIIPDSIQDRQARQNFKCSFMLGKTRTSIFHKDIENSLSLNEGLYKPVLSLYAIMDSSGTLIDYYVIEDTILVNENLTYDQSDSIIENGNNKLSKTLRTLFEIADALEHNDDGKQRYWQLKDNSKTEPKVKDDSKSDVIVREFMVLYNYLLAEIADDTKIPYIFRGQDKEYITKLINELGIEMNDYTSELISNIYLDSKYSSTPMIHTGLNKRLYSNSCDPLRKYPDLYNQYLLHRFYFRDIDFDFDPEKMERYIKYFNQRSSDLALMKAEYNRAILALRKK